jgi:hypothetical protein
VVQMSSSPDYRSFLCLVFLVLFLAACTLTFFGAGMLPKRGDVTSPESAVVYTGIQASRTGWIYSDINSYPYTAPAYGPILYVALGALARAQHADFDSVLLSGRIIVFLSFLALGPLVYFCTVRAGASHPGIGVLAALGALNFRGWSTSVRPDVPALALELLGLYFALPGKTRAAWRIVVSGLCVAAAVLLKQSMFLAAVSILFWLLTRRQFRDAAIFVASSLIPVSVTLGILSMNQPVLETMMLLRHAPRDFGTMVYLAAHSLPYSLLLLALGLAGVFLRRGNDSFRLLKIYFVLAWTLSPAMMLQVGADINYLLEGWVACALLAPVAIDGLESLWPTLACGSRWALVATVLIGAGLMGWGLRRGSPVHEYPRAAQLERLTVLSDIPYLSAHSRRPELLDPFMNESLTGSGHWSPRPILANIEMQDYDAVFLRTNDGAVETWRGMPRFDPSILTALDQNYDVLCLARSTAVLAPRKRRPLDVQRASEILNDSCTAAPAGPLASLVRLSPQMPSLTTHYYNRLLGLVTRKNSGK